MHWHFFRLRTLIYLFKLVICISGDLSNACTGQYFPTRKWKWKSDRKWCPKLSHISYLRLISFALFLHILTTLLFRTCICMIAQREKKVGDICFKRRIVWTLSKSTETHVDVLCLLLFEQMLRKRQVKTMERDETNTGKKEWKICEYNGLRLKWCRRKKTEWYGSVEQKCPNVRIKHKCSSSSLQRTREKKIQIKIYWKEWNEITFAEWAQNGFSSTKIYGEIVALSSVYFRWCFTESFRPECMGALTVCYIRFFFIILVYFMSFYLF